MAKAQIVGIQYREGTSKKTGNPYKADILHVAFLDPSRQKGFTGSEVAEIWVDRSQGILSHIPKPGDVVDIGFNRSGYVEYVDICK